MGAAAGVAVSSRVGLGYLRPRAHEARASGVEERDQGDHPRGADRPTRRVLTADQGRLDRVSDPSEAGAAGMARHPGGLFAEALPAVRDSEDSP